MIPSVGKVIGIGQEQSGMAVSASTQSGQDGGKVGKELGPDLVEHFVAQRYGCGVDGGVWGGVCDADAVGLGHDGCC